MNNGLYAACAGLLARSEALDVAASNLANISTNGYRSQSATFQSLLVNTPQSAGTNELAAAVEKFGVLGEAVADSQQGALEKTGNDTDFAIQGSGFFEIQARGGSQYTRNGNFHVDRAGHLVTAAGDAVLGTDGPLTIPPGKLSVSSDGTISVDGALAGQLKVVQISPSSALMPAGDSSFTAPAGKQVAADGSVLQGSLEGSNVNPIAAAVNLVTLQRNAGLLQRALSAFHSDFNRIAAQDLSRV